MNWVKPKAEIILQEISRNKRLVRYIDLNAGIPEVYKGEQDIKLVVLGQDPTVRDPQVRVNIDMVLNLNKGGNLKNYLTRICGELGISLSNVYATNYYKNFFINPPTTIKEINIFSEFSSYWLPLLKEELAYFPEVPVITLGEPMLKFIVLGKASPLVRHYWGYRPTWKLGEQGPFSYLKPGDNVLDRVIFPLPHQPSLSKSFYKERLIDYLGFIRQFV